MNCGGGKIEMFRTIQKGILTEALQEHEFWFTNRASGTNGRDNEVEIVMSPAKSQKFSSLDPLKNKQKRLSKERWNADSSERKTRPKRKGCHSVARE